MLAVGARLSGQASAGTLTSSVDLPAGNNNPNPSVVGFPRNDEFQDEANYYPLDYDRRHSFVSQFVWELPKLQRGGALAAIINDWQMSGVYRIVSGAPYTPNATQFSKATPAGFSRGWMPS